LGFAFDERQAGLVGDLFTGFNGTMRFDLMTWPLVVLFVLSFSFAYAEEELSIEDELMEGTPIESTAPSPAESPPVTEAPTAKADAVKPDAPEVPKAEAKAAEPAKVHQDVTSKPRRKILVGVDGGFSGDFLISDPKTGAFGLGLGSHYGMNANFFANQTVGLKVRIEHLSFQESAIGDKGTDYILTNSYLKTMQQNYWAVSLGMEWRSDGFFGRQFFGEVLLGYGIGQPSQYTVIVKQSPDELHYGMISPENTILISAGGGFRREFRDRLSAVFSTRFLAPIKSVYAGPFSNELFIPVGILFSLGLEFGF
jgi:hypothetical protein